VCYHSKGITLPHTVGTPTLNGLSSSWDFILGRFGQVETKYTHGECEDQVVLKDDVILGEYMTKC